jgi:DNA-binding CsgD family transcriptional regulator
MACQAKRLMRIQDKTWNQAIGAAAQKIGDPDYENVLLELFGQAIRHDAGIVAHYAKDLPVEVLYFQGLPRDIVDLFRREYYQVDPFTAWWRDHGVPGVVSQGMIVTSRRTDPYSSLFQRRAGINDELALFLPIAGGKSAGLFLERRKGRFTRSEVARARKVFPAIAGLYAAHQRVAPAVRNVGPQRANRSLPAISEPLSPRESEVVELVLQGYPNAAIARKLAISRGTVRNHRLSVYRKLDITSERELFLRYVELLSELRP